MLETETLIDRAYLDEVVHWVKTLNSAGVSADKAAEIAKDFLIQSCAGSSEDEDYEDDE